MPDVIVQPLASPSARDLDDLAELVTQLSTSAAPLSRPIIDAMLAHPTTTLFVARIDGRVAGMLTLSAFPTPTGIRAWVEDVVTSEAARGKGIGAMLIDAALAQARGTGARTVDLTSRPSRESANRLYQRLGFEARDSTVYRFIP